MCQISRMHSYRDKSCRKTSRLTVIFHFFHTNEVHTFTAHSFLMVLWKKWGADAKPNSKPPKISSSLAEMGLVKHPMLWKAAYYTDSPILPPKFASFSFITYLFCSIENNYGKNLGYLERQQLIRLWADCFPKVFRYSNIMNSFIAIRS